MTEQTISSSGPLGDKVLEFVAIMKQLVDKGRASGLTVEEWAPLAATVDVESFNRVGPFRDALDWTAYAEMLTQWVNNSEGWEPNVKSMGETDNAVYYQCEEMITNGGEVTPFFSLTIYRFNPAGKIISIEVYMQQDAPPTY